MSKQININSAALKLKEALAAIDALDVHSDLSGLSQEEAEAYGKALAELSNKLKVLKREIDPRFSKVEAELSRFRDSQQQTIFDFIEYVDADNSNITIGFSDVTKVSIDKAALDALSGVTITTTFADNTLAPVYSKASSRRSQSKLDKLYADGAITQETYDKCTHKVSYKRGEIIFNDSAKKSDEVQLLTIPPKSGVVISDNVKKGGK